MAYCTVSIGSGLVDSMYGKSQFPIKSYLEKRGEAFEERSILKKLFRMETSKHWAEQYTGETAADDFEPVGEGGNYPETGFEEGFPKAIVNETWKSQFAITQELVEDGRILDYSGNYDEFLKKREIERLRAQAAQNAPKKEAPHPAAAPVPAPNKSGGLKAQEKQRRERRREIRTIEGRISEIDLQMGENPEDYVLLAQLVEEKDALEERLLTLYEEEEEASV